MNDIEQLLRETFRERERFVSTPPDMSARVRKAQGRRQIRGAVTIGMAVAATAASVLGVFVVGLDSSDDPSPLASVGQVAVPQGWRQESSLGAEIIVPAGWVNRDGGCEADNGTVIRGGPGNLVEQCLGPSVPMAERSVARLDQLAARLPEVLSAAKVTLPQGHPITIAGTAAERGEGRVSDGRFTGWIKVASRGIQLTVQSPDEAVTRRILDSFRLVDVDFNGCPTTRRAPGPVGPSTAVSRAFVPDDVTAISVCFYGERTDDISGTPASGPRLHASARLSGDFAHTITAAINSHDPLPRPSVDCAMEQPQSPDAALLFHGEQGTSATVVTISNDCTGLGLDNGRSRKTIPRQVAKQIMNPLRTAYGPDPELTN